MPRAGLSALLLSVSFTGIAPFKVLYLGKPLGKARLELIAGSGWKREFKTDEQGMVEAS